MSLKPSHFEEAESRFKIFSSEGSTEVFWGSGYCLQQGK